MLYCPPIMWEELKIEEFCGRVWSGHATCVMTRNSLGICNRKLTLGIGCKRFDKSVNKITSHTLSLAKKIKRVESTKERSK